MDKVSTAAKKLLLEVFRVFKELRRLNGSDSERDGGYTYLFGCAVHDESKGTRATDNIDIAKGRWIY